MISPSAALISSSTVLPGPSTTSHRRARTLVNADKAWNWACCRFVVFGESAKGPALRAGRNTSSLFSKQPRSFRAKPNTCPFDCAANILRTRGSFCSARFCGIDKLYCCSACRYLTTRGSAALAASVAFRCSEALDKNATTQPIASKSFMPSEGMLSSL